MYNAEKLQAAFKGLVGFIQPYDPAYPQIDEALLASSSGIRVPHLHPLVSMENIYNTAPEFDLYDYAPATAQTLSTWLADKYDAAVRDLFADLIRYKRLEESNRQLIESLMLFDGVGSYSDRIIKRGRFCYLEVVTNKQQGLTVTIDRIGLQLDQAQALTLYVFHSSQVEPVQTVPLQVTKAGSFQWHTVNITLQADGADYSPEGKFYIGYFEEDLTGQAIKRESTWGRSPCVGCNGWNLAAFQKWSRFVSVMAGSVPAGSLPDAATLWDERAGTYDTTTNWGLNLSLTVSCDLTGFFITNKARLADALGLGLAVKLLEEIAYTTRMTGIADKTRALALQDLSLEDKDSFKNKYLSEIKAVAVDFSGMSSQCLPCQHRRGLKIGAV